MSETERRAAARGYAAALNTVAGLHKAFKARLETVAERFPLMATKTEARSPIVLDFGLPPIREGEREGDRFPYIALRARLGTDSEQSADQNGRATFEVEIGTYADDDDGYLDLTQVIDAIRADLNRAPQIEGTAFEHVGPLTWEIPPNQPRPQWLAILSTIWSLPRVRRVDTEVL